MKFIKVFFKNVLRLVAILAGLALINRWYLWGFSRVAIQEQDIPDYTVAYVNFVGPYSSVGPSMEKVYMILSGEGIVSYTGFGMYYDDPRVVSGNELRSDIGAVIQPQDSGKLQQHADLKIKTVVGGHKMVVNFPFKNALSSIIWSIKVYPAIGEYMLQKWYSSETPMMELYDVSQKTMQYIVDIIAK